MWNCTTQKESRLDRQAERTSSCDPNLPALLNRLANMCGGRREAGVARLNGPTRQRNHCWQEREPGWLNGKTKPEQLLQVVRLREGQRRFNEPALEVLLGALLTVKAERIAARRLTRPQQEQHDVVVGFGLFYPLACR
jgi:hypothetical protein